MILVVQAQNMKPLDVANLPIAPYAVEAIVLGVEVVEICGHCGEAQGVVVRYEVQHPGVGGFPGVRESGNLVMDADEEVEVNRAVGSLDAPV